MLKRSSDNLLNGGQVIVDYLIREKVPYAFGLCGHGNIQFIDALHERQSDIKTISVHHESVCGFMADAYYRVCGQPVATFTSCGPGSMNMPIALATAYLDSVPFLAVTGNVPTSQFGRGAFQELYRQHQADFPSTVRSICKKVYQPTRGEQVPMMVRQAWKTMVTGRPGPVVLDVPFDVFMESAAEETPKPEEWSANISSRCGADPDGVKKAVDMLLKAERPVILVGQGVKYGGATADLLALAEKLQVPVAHSMSGIGAIDTQHPLALGLLSRGGALDSRLLVHHPADEAHSRRYRSRGNRSQLSGRARADGRCANVLAASADRAGHAQRRRRRGSLAGKMARHHRWVSQGMGKIHRAGLHR
jgi:acetolactate synthase I/II/III large subunit